MKIDFNNLKQDEYELFLPSPVFSELSVEKVLKPEFIFQGVITIECDRSFMTHVEVTGDFLRVEEEKVEGQNLTIPYKIDTKHCMTGTVLKGKILFTYLGGETEVAFRVTVVGDEADVVADDHRPMTIAERPINIKSKPYTINTSKKAYNLDETAVVVIMNHESYPISVTVKDCNGAILITDKHMTIQEIGTLKVQLKQSWMDKYVTKKLYKQPVSRVMLELTIYHENGEETIGVPVDFTAYRPSYTGKVISNDRDYKKKILMSQHYYNSYIIKDVQGDLLAAKKLIEEAMAYHTTAVELRIYHILLLCELDRKSEVQEQINEILKYSSYYLDDHLDEFIEILNVLGDWLSGVNVDGRVRAWPFTGYRQLFKLRVFSSKVYGYDACELLYNNGFKSTHLFAHTAALMREKPIVPNTNSIFYRSLIMWAISKNALNEKWLTYLDRSNYQVTQHHLMNGLSAGQLYVLYPSEGTLKIYVSAIIHEGKYEVEDHAVVLEALKNNCLIKGLQAYYVHTALKHRLPLTFDNLHLHSLIRELTYDERVYVIRCYLEDDMTEKSPHLPVMRQFREILGTCMDRSLSEDEVALVSFDLGTKIQRHQWEALMGDYENFHLEELLKKEDGIFEELLSDGIKPMGFLWLHTRISPVILVASLDFEHKLMYMNWLMDKGLYNAFGEIYLKKHLLDVPEVQLIQWCVQLLEEEHPYGNLLSKELFDAGVRDEVFLREYQKCYVGSLSELLAFYNHIAEDVRVSKALLNTILYKGVLTRLYPEEILKIYLSYRDSYDDHIIFGHLNNYYAARILIEEAYGYGLLMPVFEEDIPSDSTTGKLMSPTSLALLKLYQLYGSKKEVISGNLIKNAVKNGIIFPWFADMAKPYIQTGSLRKAAFFSYHSKPWLGIKMYYRSDDQQEYTCLQMKHVFFGFYIGYVMAFYKDKIQYYFEETSPLGTREITESGIYIHEIFTEPEGLSSDYDIINTIVMSEEMNDDESIEITIREHVEHREFIRSEMELL